MKAIELEACGCAWAKVAAAGSQVQQIEPWP